METFFCFTDSNTVDYFKAPSWTAAYVHKKFKNYQGSVPTIYKDNFKFVLLILKRGLRNDEYESEHYFLFSWRRQPNQYGGSEEWPRRSQVKNLERRYPLVHEVDANVYVTGEKGVCLKTLVTNHGNAVEKIMKSNGFNNLKDLYLFMANHKRSLTAVLSRQE